MMARPSSVSPRLRKQALRLDRVQIPHRRAREKSSPAAAGAIKRNLKYIQEIALNGTDPERWEARSNPFRRFCKEGVGDIDRHVASRVTQPCRHKLRLNAGTRTMLDENRARLYKIGDVTLPLSQDRRFGSSQVILILPRYLFKKCRSTLVV